MSKSLTRKNLRRKGRTFRPEVLEPRMMLAADVLGALDYNPFHNALNPADVNLDGYVTPVDALTVIDGLTRFGAMSIEELAASEGVGVLSRMALDGSGDGFISAKDALLVINALNDSEGQSDPVIEFSYSLTDVFGNPISNRQVKVGEDFRLNMFAKDIRPVAQRFGVYSGYYDIVYDNPSAFSLAYGEIQQFTLGNWKRTAGTSYTLTFQGETTQPIPGDLTKEPMADAIRVALEGLPSVEPGDVEVVARGNTEWWIRFIGQYQKTNVPEMTVDVSNLVPRDPSQPVNGQVIELYPADVTNADTFRNSFPPGPEQVLARRLGSQGPSKYEDIGSFWSETSSTERPDPDAPVLLNYVVLHAESKGRVTFGFGRPDNRLADVLLLQYKNDQGQLVDLLDEDPSLIDYSQTLTVFVVQPVNAEDDLFPAQGDPDILEDPAAPIELDVLANDFLEEGSTGTLALDPNGLGTPDQGGTVQVSGGKILYTPAQDFFGTETFTYTAVDGLGNSDTATVTVVVTNVNDPPVAVDDTATVDEDSVGNVLDPLANDDVGPPNENETLRIESVSAVSHPQDFATRVRIVNNGTRIEYDPIPDFFGEEVFDYVISDGNGGFDTGRVTVTVVDVNDDPTAADDAVTVDENSTDNTISVLANDSIAPDANETLTIVAPLNPVNVQPGFDTRVQISGGTVVLYTPPADFVGEESFEYTIDDGRGGQDTATVVVTVVNVNDPPTAVDDLTLVAFEALPDPQTLDVLANDSVGANDVGDELTIVSVTPTAGAFDPDSTITIAPDGKTLLYIPNPNRPAVFFDEFSYTVSDGTFTDTADGKIEVLPLNRPKARDDEFTVQEDSADNVLDVTTNPAGRDFFNESATQRTLTIVTPPAHGTATVSGLDILYTPDPDFFGTDTLVYEIDDDFIGDDGQPSDPDQATVTITVENVNDDPVARDDVATVAEDSVDNRIDVLANDDDGVDEGETLTVVDVMTPAGFRGSASVSPDGLAVLYTPAPDFFGNETFEYRISDGNGGFATAQVDVTVTPVNDDPTANDDNVTVQEDTVTDIDVLANDTFAPDEGETLTITDVGFGGTSGQTEQGGTVSIVGGQVRYEPPADFFGTDRFGYSITDGNGGSDSANVTVTVENVNDPPEAVADPTPGSGEKILAIKDFTDQEIDVLANDTPGPGGETGTLTIVDVGTPSQGGTVAIAPGGDRLLYSPQTGFTGVETFTYTVSDGELTSSTTVTVDVVEAIPSDVSGFLYIDADNDGEFDEAEPFNDLNGNGMWEAGEPYQDLNGNGYRNGAELRLGGIDVTIVGRTIRGETYSRTLTTGPDGRFVFEDVLPSSLDPGDPGYSIFASQGAFLMDGKDSIGEQGGQADSDQDMLTGIKLNIFGTDNARNNRFGERGIDARYFNRSNLYASSTPFGALVATRSGGPQYWFALMEGWENVTNVSITDIGLADAANPKTVNTLKVTVQFRNGTSREKVISYGTPEWAHVRINGLDGAGGYVFRLDGTLADLGLAGGGESEGEYVESLDVCFAEWGAN